MADAAAAGVDPGRAVPSGRTILVATRNPGKAAELRAPLEALGFRVVDLDAAGVARTTAEDAVEAFETFEENALAKARYYAAASDGMPTIADDSGLAVDALDGAPGVRSRRWSGVEGSEAEVTAANSARLLESLAGDATRTARFVCVVAFVDGATTFVERGEAVGRIAAAPRGEHGFGYDPLFESDDLEGRTFAEATALEKNRVSHRARALRRLYARLEARSAAASG